MWEGEDPNPTYQSHTETLMIAILAVATAAAAAVYGVEVKYKPSR